MTILIIQGPHPTQSRLGGELLQSLQQRVCAAGRTLELCYCLNLREFVARVRTARSRTTEFALLDPGALADEAQAHPDAELRAALDELTAPYIEVHDGSSTALEPKLHPHNAPLATVIINGDLATSYRIALGIALRRLTMLR